MSVVSLPRKMTSSFSFATIVMAGQFFLFPRSRFGHGLRNTFSEFFVPCQHGQRSVRPTRLPARTRTGELFFPFFRLELESACASPSPFFESNTWTSPFFPLVRPRRPPFFRECLRLSFLPPSHADSGYFPSFPPSLPPSSFSC